MGRRLLQLGAAALLLAAALLAWGFWLEPQSLRVREHRVEIPRWSQGLAGLRVALLADLHVGSPWNGRARVLEVVRRTHEAKPDLILVPGDLVVGRMPWSEPLPDRQWVPALARLEAPLGVYVVLGNQDWASGAMRLTVTLQQAGLDVLRDEAVRITRGDDALWVVAISDLWRGPHDVKRAFAAVDDDAPVLAMTHNPDLFPEIPARASLTVAGHTHGGQVRLPLIGSPIVPSRFGQRYARGHVVEDGRHLFVHTGIGTSLVPVRFGVPPEIAILNLHPLPGGPKAGSGPK